MDNDSKHAATLGTKWLKDRKVGGLEWPSQSPDLNLKKKKNVWIELKRHVVSVPPVLSRAKIPIVRSLWKETQNISFDPSHVVYRQCDQILRK